MSQREDSDPARYLSIDGRGWRRSDPAIPYPLRSELVKALTAARRAVGAAQRNGDDDATTEARARVQDAKLALGERGRAWWLPREPDDLRERLSAAIRTLLRKRDPGRTVCPSDAARVAGADDWRAIVPLARQAAWALTDDGWLEVVHNGKRVGNDAKGAIRLPRLASHRCRAFLE